MPVRWISLSKVDTSFVFANTHSVSSAWDWITNTVAEEFECDPDDLHSEEDEDGREYVELNGVRLVEVHHQYLKRYAAGSEIARAA